MRLCVRAARGLRSDEGATAVEYALLISLIGAVIASVVALLGNTLLGVFNDTLTWPW